MAGSDGGSEGCPGNSLESVNPIEFTLQVKSNRAMKNAFKKPK